MSLADILKTEKIIKVKDEQLLSSVLPKLRSSHDAAFVFDERNRFLGVVNPYYCLIKSSYPSNAKIKHCLFHPPKIYLKTPLVSVANLFIQSKIHYLPVFLDKNKDEFLGIISARRLLSYFKDLEVFKVKVEEVLKKKKSLVVVNQNEKIGYAISLFRKTRYSKLIVIDEAMRLKGILSYFDFISYLTSPRRSSSIGDRKGFKNGFLNLPVKNLIKSYVITVSKDDLLNQVIKLILEKKIGSVIVVNDKKIPQGIITTRDILQFFIQKELAKKPKIPPLHFGGFFIQKEKNNKK